MPAPRRKRRLIRLVAFDANGTLLDDAPFMVAALNAVFLALGRPALPSPEVARRLGVPWTGLYRQMGISPDEISDQELGRLYREAYLAGPVPTLATGAEAAIRGLVRRGLMVTVLSAQEEALTRRQLAPWPALLRGLSEVCGGVSDKTVVGWLGQHEGGERPGRDVLSVDLQHLGRIRTRLVRYPTTAGRAGLVGWAPGHARDHLLEVEPEHDRDPAIAPPAGDARKARAGLDAQGGDVVRQRGEERAEHTENRGDRRVIRPEEPGRQPLIERPPGPADQLEDGGFERRLDHQGGRCFRRRPGPVRSARVAWPG